MSLRPPGSTLFPYTTLFRSTQLAEYVNRPLSTIYYWRHRGLGPRGFKIGREIRYAQADVAAWLASTRDAESRSEEHTSELQSLRHLVCRLLLEKKKINTHNI